MSLWKQTFQRKLIKENPEYFKFTAHLFVLLSFLLLSHNSLLSLFICTLSALIITTRNAIFLYLFFHIKNENLIRGIPLWSALFGTATRPSNLYNDKTRYRRQPKTNDKQTVGQARGQLTERIRETIRQTVSANYWRTTLRYYCNT